jgi:hypothetical protein
MKRHALALLIHPYKNVLMAPDRARGAVNAFIKRVIEIAAAYPSIRLNVVLPGYLLQCADPLLLPELREVHKRDCLEWLTPGYTEPFLSFSPQWLSGANIRAGIEVFEELLSVRPSGYAPPFSNWEPSFIDTLVECGMRYVVLSRAAIPREEQDLCGYWVTEHSGSSVAVYPAHVMHHYSAPANIHDWIENAVGRDSSDESAAKLVTVDYLVPLVADTVDPWAWLHELAKTADSLLHKYHPIRLGEFAALSYPRGLLYIPPQLVFQRAHDDGGRYFANYLHSFDQAGILQRKMMDIADRLAPLKQVKDALALIKQLFFAQDINRYLPASAGGFNHLHDRMWAYAKMIDVEAQLHKRDKIVGGQIRIADVLRNGTKSIVVSNKSLQVCIDHRSGGQVFELDFRDRTVNLFAGFNPRTHSPPRVIVAGKSCTSFVDHFLDEKCRREDFMARTSLAGDEATHAQFEYNVKKTKSGAKAVLSSQCAVGIDGKNYPLVMEKAFGLESDEPTLSFVYQLSNNTLTSYAFTFAVELTLTLLGAASSDARIACGDRTHGDLWRDGLSLENVSKWTVVDEKMGVSVQFVLQKPVDVWVFPASASHQEPAAYQGTTLVLSSRVSLGENAVWSLVGKMVCKKLKTKGAAFDEI